MFITNLTTGILLRGATTVFEGVQLANIDPTETLQVAVFAIDWTSGSPVGLNLFTNPLDPALVANPITLAPNSSQFVFTIDLTAVPIVTKYEIRIIYETDDDLIFNTYGLTAITPSVIIGQENIMLHSQLTKTELL